MIGAFTNTTILNHIAKLKRYQKVFGITVYRRHPELGVPPASLDYELMRVGIVWAYRQHPRTWRIAGNHRKICLNAHVQINHEQFRQNHFSEIAQNRCLRNLHNIVLQMRRKKLNTGSAQMLEVLPALELKHIVLMPNDCYLQNTFHLAMRNW